MTEGPTSPAVRRISTDVPGRLCSQSSSSLSTCPLAVCGRRGEFSFTVPLTLPYTEVELVKTIRGIWYASAVSTISCTACR